MPQITFTEVEKAEVDRLVAKHSPVNNPIAGPALRLLQKEPQDAIVTAYETMVRGVSETALVILPIVQDVIDAPDDPEKRDLVEGLEDCSSSWAPGCSKGGARTRSFKH